MFLIFQNNREGGGNQWSHKAKYEKAPLIDTTIIPERTLNHISSIKEKEFNVCDVWKE